MLDEQMDHIIREAADNHHPSYNDKAWEKMELQLDKYLPQKKDRRKFIFFLLFFLLLGGGFWFAVNQFMGNANGVFETSTAKKTAGKPADESGLLKNELAKDQIPDTQKDKVNETNQLTANEGNINKIGSTLISLQDKNNNDNITPKLNHNRKLNTDNKKKTGIKGISTKPAAELIVADDLTTKRKSITGKTSDKLKITITGADAESDQSESLASGSTAIKNEQDTKIETNAKDEAAKDSVKADKVVKEIVTKTKEKPVSPLDKKKPKKNVAGNFGITFSVGPDLSFVSLNKPGKVTLSYGAGISYNFTKRITVRTGFYFAKKIYNAAPDQYHTPGGNYPYLTDVDAVCKIYEIPVSLSYSFGQRKKHNWFGSVGLSSFIMKKEDYTYNYKRPTGQTYTYYRGVSNENKHYFSVLNLSGGYQYQLNKRLSLQAEPYFKIPLGVVGQGKVKLNSAGILFTLTVKPFAKGK